MRLDGKIAVITGASRGIGRQMALDMASAGAAGIIVAARSTGKLEALAAEVRGAGVDCRAVTADAAREADCRAIIDAAVSGFGRVDVLVNNLGIAGPSGYARDLSLDDWNATLATNLTSAFLCAKFALADMMERRSGVIINISSISGKRPLAQRLPYAVSKMGLVGLTRTLAQEVGPFGIRVNCISPGSVIGERSEEIFDMMSKANNISREEWIERVRSWSPLGEMVTEQDITRMAIYLASDFGAHMTGQDINVTSGIVMS